MRRCIMQAWVVSVGRHEQLAMCYMCFGPFAVACWCVCIISLLLMLVNVLHG